MITTSSLSMRQAARIKALLSMFCQKHLKHYATRILDSVSGIPLRMFQPFILTFVTTSHFLIPYSRSCETNHISLYFPQLLTKTYLLFSWTEGRSITPKMAAVFSFIRIVVNQVFPACLKRRSAINYDYHSNKR